jgi:hypothetical protein
VVAVWAIETVFLAFGIEVSARGFEVGTFALGHLMEVDGVLSGRKVVQLEFEGDTGSLVPDNDVADRFSLAVFDFNFGLGHALG